MAKKIDNLQALRGLAIGMVLLRHVLDYEHHYSRPGSRMLMSEFFVLGNSGVDLFFLVSGFVMVMITRKQFAQPRALPVFLYKRASRIYPLYWFYSLLMLVPFLFFPSAMHSMDDGGARVSLLHAFLLLPQDAHPLVSQGWTLVHELYFYAVFSIFLLFSARALPMLLIFWALAVVGVGSFVLPWLHMTQSATLALVFNPMTLEFIAGCFVALILLAPGTLVVPADARALPIRSRFLVGWTSLIAGLALLVGIALWRQPDPNNGWERAALYGVPCLLIIFGAVAIELHQHISAPRWLVALGDMSYSMYLSHILALSIVARVLSKHLGGGLAGHAILCAAMIVTALATAWASYHFLEMPMLKITHRLGKRLEEREPRPAKNASPAAISGPLDPAMTPSNL